MIKHVIIVIFISQSLHKVSEITNLFHSNGKGTENTFTILHTRTCILGAGRTHMK